MNKIKTSKLFFILLFFSITNVAAETAQYNVEILIFEQTHQQGIDGEQWRKLDDQQESTLTKDVLNAVPLNGAGESVIVELSSTSLTLADTREKLNNTTDYRVLYHKAWYQTVRDKDQTTAVWIEIPELKGTINLHKQRFLHFNADLTFDSTFGEVKLEQSRRLKSKELHYFDHPLFGMLVRVVKIDSDKS
ncbi:MAG: CsiV family protein [Gammaproteobacteria bacterium]